MQTAIPIIPIEITARIEPENIALLSLGLFLAMMLALLVYSQFS